MLPDFPKIKKDVQDVYIARIKMMESRYAPMAGMVKKSLIFEGNKSQIIREDGTVQDIRMKEISSTLTIDKKEMEDLPPQKVLDKLNEAAKEMAKQKTKFMVDDLNRELDGTGNSVDLHGKKFRIDDLLDVMEKIWIDFDAQGNPYLPSIFAGERAAEVIKAEMERTKDDPQYEKRVELILEKKKLEWNARENNRKLVG